VFRPAVCKLDTPVIPQFIGMKENQIHKVKILITLDLIT
jgi:hypothetical protein